MARATASLAGSDPSVPTTIFENIGAAFRRFRLVPVRATGRVEEGAYFHQGMGMWGRARLSAGPWPGRPR